MQAHKRKAPSTAEAAGASRHKSEPKGAQRVLVVGRLLSEHLDVAYTKPGERVPAALRNLLDPSLSVEIDFLDLRLEDGAQQPRPSATIGPFCEADKQVTLRDVVGKVGGPVDLEPASYDVIILDHSVIKFIDEDELASFVQLHMRSTGQLYLQDLSVDDAELEKLMEHDQLREAARRATGEDVFEAELVFVNVVLAHPKWDQKCKDTLTSRPWLLSKKASALELRALLFEEGLKDTARRVPMQGERPVTKGLTGLREYGSWYIRPNPGVTYLADYRTALNKVGITCEPMTVPFPLPLPHRMTTADRPQHACAICKFKD
jgi:hypothetical protein